MKRFISLILAIAICLSMGVTAFAAEPIETIEITGVTAPVAGETIDFSYQIPEGAKYVKYYETPTASRWVENDFNPTTYNEVNENGSWLDPGDEEEYKFEAGKYYTFVAFFDAASGCVVDENTVLKVMGETANIYMYSATGFDVWYTFYCADPNAITEIEITDVTAPVAGEVANFEYTIPEDAKYVKYYSSGAPGVWSKTEEKPESYEDVYAGYWYYPSDNYVFEAGKYYTYVACLDPAAGCYLDENATATMNDKDANIKTYSYGGFDVWYAFYCGEGEPVDPNAITEIEINDVVEPVAGETASFDFTIPADAGFKVSEGFESECAWAVTETAPESYAELNESDWFENNDENNTVVFEEGKYYTFIVYTENKDGYYYADNLTATVNGKEANYYDCSEIQYDVWYTFYIEREGEEQPIETIEITDVVEPVAGEVANFDFTIPEDAGYLKNPDQYNDISAWIKTETAPASYEELDGYNWIWASDAGQNVFEAGYYYTFVAFTQAKDGYYYADDVTATVNGNEANPYEYLENYEYDVWYTFYVEEEGEEPNVIENVEVTGIVEPVAGEIAKYDFVLPEDANYKERYDGGYNTVWIVGNTEPTGFGDIANRDWHYEDDGDLVFEAGKYYTVSVIIRADEGYSFAENVTATLNGYEAGFHHNSTYFSDQVYYTFYVEEEQPIETIEITDVAEPAAGEEASFEFSIPEDANYSKFFANGAACKWVESDSKPESYDDLNTDNVKWYFADDELVFESGKYYTVIAYVNANTGYYFADGVTATVNGDEANPFEYKEDYEYNVWYTFYVEEEPEPIDLTIEIPVEKIVTLGGNTAPSKATEFTFELFAYGEEGLDEWATVSGNSVITTIPGTYNTTVTVEAKDEDCFWFLSEGFFIREVNGGLENWTYSDAVYRVFYDYENEVWKMEAYDEANIDEMVIVEKASFTNVYTKNVTEEEEEKPVGPFPRPSLDDRDEEANPNTGAPVLFPVFAVAVLAAAFIGKKK